MKTFKICYYDNLICEQNPADVIYRFVRELLKWVENNDAMLTIKTKSRPAMRKLKHGRWLFWLKVIPAKEVYKDYPKDIMDKIAELKYKNKLKFAYGLDNIEPALEADIILVIPHGEIIHKILPKGPKHILWFKHEKSCLKNTFFFEKSEELGALLDKAKTL